MNLGKNSRAKSLKNKSSRHLVVWSKEQEIKIWKQVETRVQMVEPEHAQKQQGLSEPGNEKTPASRTKLWS